MEERWENFHLIEPGQLATAYFELNPYRKTRLPFMYITEENSEIYKKIKEITLYIKK